MYTKSLCLTNIIQMERGCPNDPSPQWPRGENKSLGDLGLYYKSCNWGVFKVEQCNHFTFLICAILSSSPRPPPNGSSELKNSLHSPSSCTRLAEIKKKDKITNEYDIGWWIFSLNHTDLHLVFVVSLTGQKESAYDIFHSYGGVRRYTLCVC